MYATLLIIVFGWFAFRFFPFRIQAVWRHSFGKSDDSDIIITDQNDHLNGPSTDSFVPHFNHSYHPVAPGYSITARSLSTKFREELR